MRDVRQNWTSYLSDFEIQLTDNQVGQFEQYLALLLEWNAHTNLTAIREPQDIELRHFLDSLTVATKMGEIADGMCLIDIGTGAGFPGLPLKILFPQLQVSLVESVGKKTNFLQTVVDELGLENVLVLNQRAEEVGRNDAHREQYDFGVARAVAGLPTLVELLLPLVKVGGKLIAQKGENAHTELAEAAFAVAQVGGSPIRLHEVELPTHEKAHYLLVSDKVEQTPERYPRRVGVPNKRPLKT